MFAVVAPNTTFAAAASQNNQTMEDNEPSAKKLCTTATISGQEVEDRISTLPDEVIIHEILGRLQPSPEQVAQFSILSKRWSRLIQSYPILEFHNTWNGCRELERRDRHAASILSKLSKGNIFSVQVIRMETFLCSPFYYDFYDRILGLAAESPLLREIDIDFGCGRCHSPDCGMPDKSVVEYSIPESFFTPNGKQFARLDTLKLQFCAFWLYENLALTNFSCLGSSLKVLSLQHVQFPNAEIFYSMIDHASLLDNLTLNDIRIGSPMKFQIQNKPNLKILNLSELYLDTLEIGGIDSLEEFRVTGTHMEDFKMWSTPHLKVLHIEGFSSMELINKLISEHPLLESLTLECPSDETRELKIVHSEKLRDVTLKYSHGDGSVVIDAPMLTNFTYQGESSYFPKISIRNPVGSSTEVVAVICLKSERVNVSRLKQFLVVLSRFQLSTVELASFGSLWGKDEEESPPPAVECLKFRAKPPSCERHLRTNLDYFFQCCHPKILCFTEPSSEQVPNSLFLPNLENMCKQFTKRDCKTGCNCWRHQLKDVKMVRRVVGEGTSVEQEKVMEVSMDTVSSLGEAKQEVWFILTWH